MPPIQLCSVCTQPGLLRCSRCLGVLYCGVDCQKQAWKEHKEPCKKATELKKKYEAEGVRSADEFDERIVQTMLSAQMGHPGAQNNLGLSYSNGLGVALDKVAAFKWFKLSAEAGNPEGQNNLGFAYFAGNGVLEDKKEAFKWFKLSSEAGYPDAMNNLGVAYFFGDGVSEDKQEALKWWKKAAEKGCQKAMINVGNCYRDGNGVKADKIEAFDWYSRSILKDLEEEKKKNL